MNEYPLANDPEWLAEMACERVWQFAGLEIDIIDAFEALITEANREIQVLKQERDANNE